MNKTAWEIVQKARSQNRPTAKMLIDYLFTDFIELHGDRLYHDDKALLCGIAYFNNTPITVIAIEKGKTTSDKIKTNFGMAHPEGYHKSLRLIKQAEKFKRPIFFIIDTPGAYPGVGAEERGQAWAISQNLLALSKVKTITISLILSEGGSGGALALALSDQVWMCENAIYSILSPEGFASILYKDVNLAKDASSLMKLTAKDLYEYHLIDDIIKEVEGSMDVDPYFTFNIIKEKLQTSLLNLKQIPIDTLLEKRYQKYRKMGEAYFKEKQ